ncbi:uncharacterized protein LOC121761836 [Salvia splendens]|uniref:uncharacterized protein LOC121761836 n=1 Tax=Salvia splendens TaxID=180675 RepID=UPI001C264355|nr:uncharacterized protein LOC121761836 [Salvia splendens]
MCVGNKLVRSSFYMFCKSCNEVMKGQCRLCVHCNTLFAFNQVYNSIKSDCASTARSMLYLGPYHQYPVQIPVMDLKLLWVLEARSVRFYHIPLEIMKLVCLRYLSLTCNEELPISISNLLQLQSLIIKQHMSIKKCGVMLYMPMEIWDMQELQHIEVVGRDLPTPNSNATLDKLSCLFGVTEKSCNRDILKRIPNLKSLGIQVELMPYVNEDDGSNPLIALDYISDDLQNLTTLHYYVKNPDMKYESVVSLSMFPSTLTALMLSGFGCTWKHMNDIGSLLPNLETHFRTVCLSRPRVGYRSR